MSEAFSGDAAARLLWSAWLAHERIDTLPADARPATRSAGYAVQSASAGFGAAGAPVGWKIAATSPAGQAHINVSGPLAGRLFAGRMHGDGHEASLAGNAMRVAECEIGFRMARALPPRPQPYAADAVLAAVASVHPAIELPDSRFRDFTSAGEAQLIADHACTNDFLFGPGLPADERLLQLADHRVEALRNGSERHAGYGRNVLGDPLNALVWIANELSAQGLGLAAGEIVITGACVPPIPVQPGDTVEADYGWIGRLGVRFAPAG